MWNRYEVKVKTDFKKLVSFFLFWIVLSSVSFAYECPVQEFKQYAEKLDKTKVESIDSLKENYKKTASEQSKQCRSMLFSNFRHFYDQMTQTYIASVEEKLNEKYPLSPQKEKKYKEQLSQVGLSIYQSEGMYYVEADSAWFSKEFSASLSNEWKRFLKQSEYEVKNRLAEDGAPLISWEEMRKRIIFWEKFLHDHSGFSEKNIVEESLSRYLTFYLGRLGNYWLILAYDTKKNQQTKKLDTDVKKSYENFIKLNNESKYYDMVKSQYTIIKDHAFIIDKKTAKKLDVNYDCAKRELSMAESSSEYFDASFKCCRASTSIEKYICSDKELADIDKELGIVYEYVKTYSSKKQEKVLLKKQRAWAKNRKKACHVPKKFMEDAKVVECLKDEYLSKMDELITIIDGDSLELDPWYYTKRDSKDPFAGYYSQFYEVHSATTLEDSSIVENFLSIIKIKDPKMKNKYRISGDFTCANYHVCNIYTGMLSYIIMELKDGKLVFSKKAFDDDVCKFSIEKKNNMLVINDNYNVCTQYIFSCGARCGLNGYEFKLKTTDEFAQNNTEEKFYPFQKDTKFGFINIKGEWVIKPQFDEAQNFDEEINNTLTADVKLNGKEGTINRKGEFTPRRSEDDVEGDSNISSTDIVQKNVSEEKIFPLKKDSKYGFVNKKGEWIIKPQFDDAIEFLDANVTMVKVNGKRGIINTKGQWVIREYDEILYGQENLIVDINGWIKVKLNGKWGAVNTDGKWIFKPQFDNVASFTVQGQLTVKHNGKWGFIDTKGKWVLEPKYDDVYDFAENDATGFGRIIRNGKEGYVSDVDGLLLEPILDIHKYSPDLESISVLQKTGLLKVGSRYDKWGIIDRKGKWLLKQRFDAVEILDDKIHVKFADKEGYTSLDGKYLTFTKNELAQGFHSAIDRHYPFVCYSKKSKNPEGKVIYQGCVRSDEKCSGTHKMHFGEYPNDLKAHEAFKRCSKRDPKFVDPQEK